MLFVATKTLDHQVEHATRTPLIEKLQEKGLLPLIRSARLSAYELALAGADRAREMERLLATQAETTGEAPYVPGDLFCFDDYVHFLIFGDEAESTPMRAGIIYATDTAEPEQKLDSFCRNVYEALEAARGFSDLKAASALLEVEWQSQAAPAPDSFTRFAAEAETEGAEQQTARSAMVADWLRVAGMLEDTTARQVLRRLVEVQNEGRGAAALVDGVGEDVSEALLDRLAGAGLVKREILVSCLKAGRPLFRLPSPDALGVLNASNAICTECGAAIADEKADEITVPTSLTTTLLQDGSWLTTHLRSILNKLGLADGQISTRPVSGAGESRAMAYVAGESFLFLLHDGDWTAADTRRALDEQTQGGPAHLVIIATGKIHEEVRQRLREQARRRAHGGRASEVLFIEGMETVAPELEKAFARVAANALNEELWPLDGSLGLNVAQMIATRFQLLQHPLRELAASAAGAVAGSLSKG
ncbi:MAG: hypothetical protein ACJ74W_03500 [Pyrinomonadaceae bacterium]